MPDFKEIINNESLSDPLLNYWKMVYSGDLVYRGDDGQIYRKPLQQQSPPVRGPKTNDQWTRVVASRIKHDKGVQITIPDLPKEGQTGRGHAIQRALEGDNIEATYPCGCVFRRIDGADYTQLCNDNGPVPCCSGLS